MRFRFRAMVNSVRDIGLKIERDALDSFENRQHVDREPPVTDELTG